MSLDLPENLPNEVVTADRELIRQRPAGWPVMHQTWDKLLFLHWPVETAKLRPLVPAELEIDTWEGTTWIGVTPFTIRGLRPPLVPPLPLLSSSHELNVRIYVHRDRVPGIWFLSLDASNAFAVWGARLTYFLPYYCASMDLESDGTRVQFRSVRTHRGAVPAELHASWQLGSLLPDAVPGTRDFFLIERYCLYTTHRGRMYRARIHHRPWPLCRAEITHFSSNIVETHGLQPLQGAPLIHAQAEPLQVWIWPPKRIDS
jgi:uncharacterized protein